MAFKIAVVVLICVGFVRTDIGTITVLNSAPEAESNTLPILEKQIEVNDPYPQYHYSYNVQDTLSGDSKSQFETRDGDVINGEYSLNDADGYRRTVKYTADSIHGFNAVVQRLPINQETKTTPLNASPAAPFNTFPAEVVSTSLTGTTSPTIATTVLTPLTAQLPSNIIKPAQNSYAAPLALTSHQPYTQPTSVQSLNNFNFPHGLTSYTRPLPFSVPPTYVSTPDLKTNEPTFSYSSPKFVPPFNAYTYTSVPQEPTYDVPNTHIANNNYGSPATYSYPYQISSGYSHSHAPNAPTLSPRQNIYSYKAPFFYNNYPSPYY